MRKHYFMENELWLKYKTTCNNRWGTVVWEVSNYGNVKMNGKLYECGLNNRGYKMFADVYLHKAVTELFIGPQPGPEYQVDHIDTNKLNNRVDNLRWVTPKENSNNKLTLQHIHEAQNKPEVKQKMSEAKTGENNPMYGKGRLIKGENNGKAKQCVYNGIEFGCIKDAWEYAKTRGYNKSYGTFCEWLKNQ